MIAVLLGKLSTLGAAAKAGIVAGAVAATGSAAAVTGTLPPPAQDRAAAAVERIVGLEIPGGSRADGEHRQDNGRGQDGEHRPAVAVADAKEDNGAPADAGSPAQAQMGKPVSTLARSGAPSEDGRSFGQTVSTMAGQSHAPTERPSAIENPGTPHATNAADQAPAAPPADDAAAGSDNAPAGGVPSPLPTSGSNPGTPYATDPGTPEALPTRDDNPGTGRRP